MNVSPDTLQHVCRILGLLTITSSDGRAVQVPQSLIAQAQQGLLQTAPDGTVSMPGPDGEPVKIPASALINSTGPVGRTNSRYLLYIQKVIQVQLPTVEGHYFLRFSRVVALTYSRFSCHDKHSRRQTRLSFYSLYLLCSPWQMKQLVVMSQSRLCLKSIT